MLRKQTSEKNPADWFAFAEDRLKCADSLWKHEGLTAAGIEILQEASERYLKGYLVAKGWELVRTHDLERLVKEAAIFSPEFAQFRKFALELTEDFFAQHYPGEDTTETGQNYVVLRKEAGEMIQLLQRELPNYF